MRMATTPAELRLWACCPANRNMATALPHHKVSCHKTCHLLDCRLCHDGCAPEATTRAKNKRPCNCIPAVEPDRSMGHPTKCSRPALANCAHRWQRKVQGKTARTRVCSHDTGARCQAKHTRARAANECNTETPACAQSGHTRTTTTSMIHQCGLKGSDETGLPDAS